MAGHAERIAVVGISGSGKSTFARALAALGYGYLELDGLRHRANWRQASHEEMDLGIANFLASASRWVIDGNYAVHRDRIWTAADCIVWLDLPRRVTTASCAWRSLRRVVTRETLWNGNHESVRNLLSRDPEQSVIAWSYTKHAHYREELGAAQQDPRWGHLRWHRLTSRRAANALLAQARKNGRLPLPVARQVCHSPLRGPSG